MTDPIAAYRFDGTGSTIIDSMGLRDLTLGANGQRIAGKNGTAVSPIASNAPAGSGPFAFTGWTQFTIMGWVKVIHTGSYATMLSLYDATVRRLRIGRGGSLAFHAELQPASSMAWVFSTADGVLSSSAYIHVAVRWNRTGTGAVELLLDGAPISQSQNGAGAIPGPLNADTLYFGDTAAGTAAWDDLRIFNVALSDAEILALRDVPVPPPGPANAAPIANAGPDQSANAFATVTLTGAASSDSDGTIASYAWAQTGGAAVTLSGTGATRTFTAPNITGPLTFELTVTDDDGATATDTVVINVTANVGPTASAGADQSANAGATVTLNGSGSTDSDGTIASYAWTQTGGTAVTLAGTGATRTFTAPNVTGVLTFQLVVTDDDGATGIDTMTVSVTATPANQTPVANAGPDQSVLADALVTLNGSGSADPDGTIASYAWTQISGPTVALSGSGATRTFTAPNVNGTLVFRLTVTDNGGASSQDTVAIAVTVPVDPVVGTGVTGGYVRHRDRMVQESVYEDLRDTLIACRWLAGTTARPVRSPYAPSTWEPATTSEGQLLPLLEGNPVDLIDYFPEAEGKAAAGEPSTGKTPLNTLALDNGTRIDSAPVELGNATAETVTYRFNMAFFASSDAVAQAVFADLADRYKGRFVRPEVIELWNFNSDDELPVVRMGVESFSFTQNTDQSIAPHEVHLYFAELVIEDEVD